MAGIGVPLDPETINPLDVMRLAVALGISDDATIAARIAGVPTVTKAKLEKMEKLARSKDYKGARECNAQFITRIYNCFLALNGISLIEQEASMSVGVRPQASKMSQGIIDALGGQAKSYGEININLGKKKKKAA